MHGRTECIGGEFMARVGAGQGGLCFKAGIVRVYGLCARANIGIARPSAAVCGVVCGESHAADVSGLRHLVGVGDVLGAATASGVLSSEAIGRGWLWAKAAAPAGAAGHLSVSLLENHTAAQPGGLTRRPIGPSSRLEMIVLGLQ